MSSITSHISSNLTKSKMNCSPAERAILRRIRRQRSPWIGNGPAIHSFVNVLKSLNPVRSSFDCAVKTIEIIRNTSQKAPKNRKSKNSYVARANLQEKQRER